MFDTLLWNILVISGISICIFVVIVILSWIVSSVYNWAKGRPVNNESIRKFYPALPFGLAAIVLGFLSGLSYEPAVSALITGVVSLISGAAFIAFHKNTDILMPVGIIIAVFSLNLLAGATVGTEVRDEALTKNEKDITDEWLTNSRVEFRVNNYRNNLDLKPLELPNNYVIKSDGKSK